MHHRHQHRRLADCPSLVVVLLLGFGSTCLAASGDPDPAATRQAYLEHLRATKGVVDIRLVHDSGSGPGAFNLMVVSAGFTANDAKDFYAVCETLSRALFSEQPWKKYQGMVNVYGVLVDDESPAKTRVEVTGYEGQVLSCQNKPAIEFANYAGKSDNTVVVHNSAFSTPTCGPWAMVTCHRGTAGDYRVLHHELGHSVGGLGDKYTQRPGRYDGSIKNLWEGKNATDQPNPLLTQWHYWTQDRWPGPFDPLPLPKGANVINVEGAAWATGFYRPEEKCVMHGGDSPTYCTICNEIMESCFFRTIDLFEEVTPPPGERVLWSGETQTFTVKALKFIREPQPGMQSRLELHVDGQCVATSRRGEVSFLFGGERATPGHHQLGVNLNVQAEFVRRDDGFLGGSRAWRVTVMPHEKPRLAPLPSVTVRPGETVRVPVEVDHPRKGLVAIRMSHAPEGATLHDGSFEWRAAKPGAWLVDFTASIDQQDAVTESLEIHVKPEGGGDGGVVIRPLAPVDALVGKETIIPLEATSQQGGQLLYRLLNPREGMNLDRATGRLTWIPRVDQYGPYRLRFRVGDGSATSEGDVLIGVCSESAPYLNSYLTTYVPDRNQWLKDHEDTPVVYERVFELSRMLRERFSDIYTPALEAAKRLYPNLDPGVQAAFRQELARHAWAFVDRPAILQWLKEISASGGSESERALRSQVKAIRLWSKVKEVELGGDPAHLRPLLDQFAKTDHVGVQSAIRRAVKALYGQADDKDAFRATLGEAVAKAEGPPLVAMLPLLPVTEMPGRQATLLRAALDPDERVSRGSLALVDLLTTGSTAAEIATFARRVVTSSDERERAIVARIVDSMGRQLPDRNACQQAMLDVLEQETGPGRADLVQLLPLVREPRLMAVVERFATDSDARLASAAQAARRHLEDEVGATDAFVSSWSLSGPYPIEGGRTVFAPETGDPVEWKPYQCPQASGPRIVPLGEIFGGDNRVAYMKAVVRADAEQTVLFGAGSDDGIEVWLNGELIHSRDVMRGVNPDEDRFTGLLKAGRNELLCKIKQIALGWGGCLSIRAADGGPALGVSIEP